MELSDEQEAALAEAREVSVRDRRRDLRLVRPQPSAELAWVEPGQTEWTREQWDALAKMYGLANVPAAVQTAYLRICIRANLDPFKPEIYLIKRRERLPGTEQWVEKWVPQTGINGFRSIAERTGLTEAQFGPFWCGEDGEWLDKWIVKNTLPAAARYGIKRSDRTAIEWGTVNFTEFCAYTKDGKGRTGQWGPKPSHMIAKCAMAQAVRQVYPRQAGGIYEPAEFDRVDSDMEALADRDKARRALIRVPWDKDGGKASPADTAPGDVIQGEVVALDRDALWAELESYAREQGKTPSQVARRQVAAHRKNVDEFDAEELEGLLAPLRAQRPQPESPEPVPPPEPVVPVEEPEEIAPHSFEEWSSGGECWCKRPADDAVHTAVAP